MNEEERKALDTLYKDLFNESKSGDIDIELAGETILAHAKDFKELRASSLGSAEHGSKGYNEFSVAVRNSTFNAVSKVLFAGLSPSPASFIREGLEDGLTGDELVNSVISKDPSGFLKQKQEVIRKSIDYIYKAYKYDEEHLQESYDLAYATMMGLSFQEPKKDELIATLKQSGIAFKNEPAENTGNRVHQLLVQEALSTMGNPIGLPRWALILMRRPGMDSAAKQQLVDTWNRDDNGKRQICELYLNELESIPAGIFDIDSADKYLENYELNNYYGLLTFDREYAFSDFEKCGFFCTPEKKSDLKEVCNSVGEVYNHFNAGIGLLEHPWSGYIENIDGVTIEQCTELVSAIGHYDSSEENNTYKEEASLFGKLLANYTFTKLPDYTKVKEILAYNKKYEGDEKTQHLNEWYSSFKQILAAQGIDLNDPVAMARIQAQVPESSFMYMPAMTGMDGNFHRKDRPPFADAGWYAANMNSAADLTLEQIENLYELSRNGKLAVYGKDMSEDSLRVIYNDKNDKPQLSRPLVEVNSHEVYGDINACAREMFPDAVIPDRVYSEACNVHGAIRNEVPMITGEDFSYEIDNEEAVRVAFNRTVLRDYFENTDKYKNDPDYAEDRAAQIYVVSKYNNSQDQNFMSEFEKYVEENDISFESDNKVLTDQEKAIQSLNDPKMIGIRMPELTDEMINFVNSLDSVLKENGWDMDIYSNRASLRIFTDKEGLIREIPACASLNFGHTKDGFYYDYHSSVSKQNDESPEEFAGRYLAQNTGGIKFPPKMFRDSGTPDSEKLRAALIYESAKKGQLLISKPGEPVTSAVPIIPGEDGKAKVVTDFDSLGVEERKKDYYINASRMRRLYKDPEEAVKQQYLKKYTTMIDASSFDIASASMASAASMALSQAKKKGIGSKEEFIDQAMAVTPSPKLDFASYIDLCNDECDLDIDFKPRRFSANQTAARKELSAAARRAFLGTEYEKDRITTYADKAVSQGVISREKADELIKVRGLLNVFLDRSTAPGAMENNIEAIRILGSGTVEEKTDLYNRCLAKFADFDPVEFFGVSDADLVRRWPEIDENMYRLQELIRINKDLEKSGIYGDAQLLKEAMNAERYSGDVYLYMTNRVQAIANPAYEIADIDQLLSLDSSDLSSITSIDVKKSGAVFNMLASNLQSAKMGVQLAAASYIGNLLADKFGAEVNSGEFYDLNGDPLNQFAVYDELVKGNAVYAAGKGEDEVHAFKAGKGKFKAVAQPDSKYSKKINSLTQARREKREQAEKKEVDQMVNEIIGMVEKSEAEFEAAIDLAEQGPGIKADDFVIDGDAFNNQSQNEEKQPEALKPEEAAKEEKPQAAPPKSELEIQREKTSAYLKEEISYQQFKLGLIIDSYGPGKPFGDKTADYVSNVRACMTDMLAAARALEQAEKNGVSKEELEKLGSKDGLKAVKSSMINEKALKMTLDSLQPDGAIDTALIERFALRADEIRQPGTAEQADHSTEPDSLYEAKSKVIRDFYSTRYTANLTADKLEQQIKEQQRQAEMKRMAKDAMQQGIGKYQGFSEAMDKFIADGREALYTSVLDYSLENGANAKDMAKQSFAVLFAAVTVKDIIDSKYMTYEQTRALCSDKGIKASAQEIMKDPGFDEFFKTVRPNAEKIYTALKDPGSYREKLKSMLDEYKVKHNEVQKQAGGKKNVQTAAAGSKKPKTKGLQ